ncbi:MAG: toxin-antitoxin system YwqK family antitoxin [Sandaracinaceae bacterium]
MPSILALVSKAVFKKQHPGAELGAVLPFDAYHSKNKRLTALAKDGDLYLVTVRPDDVLWLVAVLRRPTFTGDGWVADANTVAVRDITSVIPELVFASGKGLSPDPGKLGMSLQTPRELTAEDVLHLGDKHATKKKPAITKKATAKKKPTATKKPAATKKRTDSAAPPTGIPAGAEFDLAHRRWSVGERDADGLRTGVWRTYREDGSLYWEEGFVLSRLHGVSRGYHPDGSLGVESRFEDGREGDATSFGPNGQTDIPGFDHSVPGLVRWRSLSDGRYGATTTELLDAEDRRITLHGERLPDPPDGVPMTARYGAGDPSAGAAPGWNDGVLERGSQEELGLHRWWSEQGELTLRVLFDDQGRQR